jgi:hypothetical protein
LLFIEDENMNEKKKKKHQSSLDAIRLTSPNKSPRQLCLFHTVVRTPTTTTAGQALLLVSSGRRLRG